MAYANDWCKSLLCITPFYRSVSMDLLANWSLSYVTATETTENQSFGAQIKYRHDFAPLRTRIIVGLDIDHSPGSRSENRIATTTTGSGYTRVYTDYTPGARVYDHDLTYQGTARDPWGRCRRRPNRTERERTGIRAF